MCKKTHTEEFAKEQFVGIAVNEPGWQVKTAAAVEEKESILL